MTQITVGEALTHLLEQAGVDTVFGIPGVHTVELYRGLHASPIRHITPRHEQGAAFMADGYARRTGRPGLCLLITGPGLSNAATAVVQARNDSFPMLVISSVNATGSLGKAQGHLHELPDQAAFAASIFLETHRLLDPNDLEEIFAQAWARTTAERPGPVHLEIPIDVLSLKVDPPGFTPKPRASRTPDPAQINEAAALCKNALSPTLILGGGASSPNSAQIFQDLAVKLDAPTISTSNGRGIMGNHPLSVPASPSLASVRDLITSSDLVLTIGSEMGPTDFDMYQRGALPPHPNMIRVDIDPTQLAKRHDKGLKIAADSAPFAQALSQKLPQRHNNGQSRAKAANQAARAELPPGYASHITAIEAIWRDLPDAIIVGDSTQSIYAGNLFLNAPHPRRWFNASSGFGTLGYALPAAIGASLAAPNQPIICLIGDGGLQFTLPELATAKDTNANVAVVVWNNEGYLEIETSMRAAGVSPVGVSPKPPDLMKLADAYGLPAVRITDLSELNAALLATPRPCLIEYHCPAPKPEPHPAQ